MVCPFCPGIHIHQVDGLHWTGCNGPRASYVVRSQTAAQYVRLLLHHLKFQPHQVDEIMDAIADAQIRNEIADAPRQAAE